MLRDSYLQWMKDYMPEHLESLLTEKSLDAHLEEKMAQAAQYWKRLEAQGTDPWKGQELVDESLMPHDQPDPERKFSGEGKRLLKEWQAKQGTTA